MAWSNSTSAGAHRSGRGDLAGLGLKASSGCRREGRAGGDTGQELEQVDRTRARGGKTAGGERWPRLQVAAGTPSPQPSFSVFKLWVSVSASRAGLTVGGSHQASSM
ncbi:hypothetical protein H1C71_039662 [Ictidomys tridecemlineatus]|nr:hypothetical protein H1C71_039662 [Ictidomys tridecemlineatus]